MISIPNNYIDTLELIWNELPVNFAFATMEQLDILSDGIADEPHRHNYYTVIWPTKSGGKHIIDFKEYSIIKDRIFFVSPFQVHQVITEREPTGFVLLFTPDFLSKHSINENFISNLKLFKKADETPPLEISQQKSNLLKGFIDEISNSFSNGGAMSQEVIGAYLKLFLIECNNLCDGLVDSNTQNVEVETNIVKSFKDLLENKYQKHHQVKDYADLLNVTPNYLNEVIKNSVNASAKELIQERLILEAKRLLLFTSNSIKEIGFLLGFEDPSHFSKFFKNNSGVSLQEFRLNGKKSIQP